MNATNSAVQDENDSELCPRGACLSRCFCKSPREPAWGETPENLVHPWGAGGLSRVSPLPCRNPRRPADQRGAAAGGPPEDAGGVAAARGRPARCHRVRRSALPRCPRPGAGAESPGGVRAAGHQGGGTQRATWRKTTWVGAPQLARPPSLHPTGRQGRQSRSLVGGDPARGLRGQRGRGGSEAQ